MVTTRPRSYRDTTARRLVPQLSAENLCNCTEESVQRASTETLNLLSALLFEIRGCKRPRGIVDCDIFFFLKGRFSIFLLGFYSIPFYFIIKFSLFLFSDQLVCLMDIFYYIFYYFRILFII